MPGRQGWRRRLRRPAAVVGTTAVLAVLVPAGAASASSAGFTLVSGEEKAGGTATYDATCALDEGVQGYGASWQLYDLDEGQVTHVEPFSVTAQDEQVSTGAFTVSFGDYPPARYELAVMCWINPAQTTSYTSWKIVSTKVQAITTSTSLGVDRTRLFPGEQATLTATVTNGTTGLVDFRVGGRSVGQVPLSGGTATLQHAFTEPGVVEAYYLGDGGAVQPSHSGGTAVDVVTEITSPGAVGISTWTAVGTPQQVAVGTWSPSVEDGLQLAYTWKVDGVPVGYDATYTPTPAQVGKQLTVEVVGSHPKLGPGTEKLAVSPAAPIHAGTQSGDAVLTGTVGGRAVLGTPLVVQPTGWAAGAQYTYAWRIGDQQVAVTGPTYTPGPADLGKSVWVDITVTAPGMEDGHDYVYAQGAVVAPSVTVGSRTVTIGHDAVVPVTVAGPAGAVVPAGGVVVTLTPAGGGTPVVLPAAALDGAGHASATFSGLAVGSYAVSAAYDPSAPQHDLGVATAGGSTAPYTAATGSGTVTVVRATPSLDAPVTVTVPVATAGSFVAKVGGTYRPGTWSVREGDRVLAQGDVAEDGTVTVPLPILKDGAHDLVLDLPQTASSAAVSRAVRVVVVGEPARTGTFPSAELDTPKAATRPGQSMELVAEGFAPGETVAFYLHSDPVFLGTALADASGVARLVATVPANVPAGSHTVIATGGTSGRWATLAVELATPAAAAPAATTTAAAATPGLATTGAQSGALLAGAWVMLLVGGGLVLVARRIRATR